MGKVSIVIGGASGIGKGVIVYRILMTATNFSR